MCLGVVSRKIPVRGEGERWGQDSCCESHRSVEGTRRRNGSLGHGEKAPCKGHWEPRATWSAAVYFGLSLTDVLEFSYESKGRPTLQWFAHYHKVV